MRSVLSFHFDAAFPLCVDSAFWYVSVDLHSTQSIFFFLSSDDADTSVLFIHAIYDQFLPPVEDSLPSREIHVEIDDYFLRLAEKEKAAEKLEARPLVVADIEFSKKILDVGGVLLHLSTKASPTHSRLTLLTSLLQYGPLFRCCTIAIVRLNVSFGSC